MKEAIYCGSVVRYTAEFGFVGIGGLWIGGVG